MATARARIDGTAGRLRPGRRPAGPARRRNRRAGRSSRQHRRYPGEKAVPQDRNLSVRLSLSHAKITGEHFGNFWEICFDSALMTT
jgi:hypothetical protein